MDTPLADRVAVVTGASRGAGRAIAAVLGERRATVYVTGRSSGTDSTEPQLGGTIEDAAKLVAERGGRGIAVRCDHTRDADVEALFARVRDESGRLDVLVNNVWGGYEGHDLETFAAPFWEQPLARRWDGMFVAGVRAHFAASRLAAPLLIERGRGLIVQTVAWSYGSYLGNLFYDTAKAAIARMAFGMGRELEPHGIASVALACGFMRTERVLHAHSAQPFDLSVTESPEYAGRAVAALAADPDVMRHTGQTLAVGDLAREYGFHDIDGRQPEAFRLPDEDERAS